MSRYTCPRCQAMNLHGGDIHICADVAARHARAEAQRDAVQALLIEHGVFEAGLAEDIVAVLNRMGIRGD